MECDRGVPGSAGRYLIPDLPSSDDLLPYLRRIDAARWYSNFGPLVSEFEQGVQDLLSRADSHSNWGRISLTTLSSGHHALEVGLNILGMHAGKRVLLPAVTFTSCPLAVLNAGAEAVLADVDALHWTLTPEIARRVAARVKIDAVMPVAAYGVPLPASGWNEFTEETGIPVIVDAAAAIESQQIPRLGLVAHSLHATKPFGVGEGGILVSRDSDAISSARTYANFGMIDRICHSSGSNTKMSEYHAAVGLAQLRRWDDVKQRRSLVLDLYKRHLSSMAGSVWLHPLIDQVVTSCLMMLLRAPIAERVADEGKAVGLGFHRTYLPPLYHHPRFSHLSVVDGLGMELPAAASYEHKREHMRNSERLREHLIGVPFHPFIESADVAGVIRFLRTQLGGDVAGVSADQTEELCVAK